MEAGPPTRRFRRREAEHTHGTLSLLRSAGQQGWLGASPQAGGNGLHPAQRHRTHRQITHRPPRNTETNTTTHNIADHLMPSSRHTPNLPRPITPRIELRHHKRQAKPESCIHAPPRTPPQLTPTTIKLRTTNRGPPQRPGVEIHQDAPHSVRRCSDRPLHRHHRQTHPKTHSTNATRERHTPAPAGLLPASAGHR